HRTTPSATPRTPAARCSAAPKLPSMSPPSASPPPNSPTRVRQQALPSRCLLLPRLLLPAERVQPPSPRRRRVSRSTETPSLGTHHGPRSCSLSAATTHRSHWSRPRLTFLAAAVSLTSCSGCFSAHSEDTIFTPATPAGQ